MILESIVFAVLLLVLVVLIVDNLRIRFSKTKETARYIQAEIDKSIMSERLQELMSEKELNKLQESDGFIKFLSDSRDWAFTYIEEVQGALDEFDKKVSPILEYYSTYGSVIDGLHLDIAKDVSNAYEDLKKVLPSR